jgi:hypothetical protein
LGIFFFLFYFIKETSSFIGKKNNNNDNKQRNMKERNQIYEMKIPQKNLFHQNKALKELKSISCEQWPVHFLHTQL